MISKFCIALAVIFTAFISIVCAQQTEKVTSSGIGYLEYLPQDYHSNSNKYPVVISLHGIKEKGTSSTDPKKVLADLHKVDNVGLPKYVKYGTKYPFILISPQLKSNQGMWVPSYIMQVLNHVKKYLRIDERRIYLTGLSLGGFGVWRTAGEYPEVFAAIAPICAGGNALNKAHEIAAKNLPTWGFHGDRDNIVSYTVTTRMVNAINSAPKKPKPMAKATIFPGMGHIIWDKAYQKTNLLDWMLSHRKGASAPDNGNDDDNGNENPDENDGDKDEDEDEDEDETSNKAPTVRAGSDRTIVLPANSLQLQGNADDPDGKITSYRWTKVSGGSASLNGTTSSTLHVSNLKEGVYIFSLTARDNDGATRSDKLMVTVKKGDEEPSSSKNALPVVYSGPDRIINLPTDAVTVNGKATDKDGKIVAYEWAQTYGKPAGLNGAHTPSVRIYNLQRGIYIFRLRAKDDDGGIKDDYFKITVNDPRKDGNSDNSIPHAYAGPDRVIRLPNNSVTIQGQASDKDGKIVSYQWAQTYGRPASLSGDRSSRVRIYNLRKGIYIFRLSVKDNRGAVKDDYFKITVDD